MDNEDFKDAVAYGLGIAMKNLEAATYISREGRNLLKKTLIDEIMHLNEPQAVLK